MSLAVSIFCLVVAFIARKTEKSILNPLTFFSIMWGVIVFLSQLQLYKLRATSEETYSMIFVGLISFVIGYYSLRFVNIKFYVNKNEKNRIYKYSINYPLLIIVGISILILQLPNFNESLSLLLKGQGLDGIRSMAQRSDSMLNNVSAFRKVLNIFFISPFSLVLVVLSGVDFWLGKKNKLFLFISIAIPLMSLISNGGRASFINFLLSFVLSFFLFNRQKVIESSKKLIKKNYFVFLILLIVSIVLIFKASLSRSGQDSPVALLYYYFSMEPIMLETWIDKIPRDTIGLGTASLNGFIFPIIYLIVNFLGIQYPRYWKQVYDLTMLTDSEWVIIAGGRTANAYVSLFWFFYLDGGILGVILGMFLYGLLLGSSFKNAFLESTTNIKFQSMYIIYFVGLLYSFARIQFTLSSYALAVLYLYLFSFKKQSFFMGEIDD